MKSFKRQLLIIVSFICTISGVAQNQNSLYFDGINDKVDLPAATHTGITTNGTLEAWIKTSFDNSGYRGIVVCSGYYGLFLIDNKLSTFVWGGGAQGATTYNNVSLNDGTWHHVALRFQIGVTDGTQMYLDGQPVGPAITLDVTPASNNFQMGCNTTVQFFNGQIDNVKIYSRALSASEINDSYNCLTVNSTGLKGSYNFNQGVAAANNSGITTLSDQSGNNNNGTLLNFALNGSTSNWVNGKSCCFLSSNITGTTSYCQGQTMNLTASFVANPGESITGYQWKKNGVNLTNGGNISGATSANLQIANLVSSDFATYSVEVTSTCGVGFNSENITQSGIINISNLTAYYPLNNGSSADATGNNYNATGTATTSVNDRLNQANSAMSFNGSSSTVTIAAPAGQVVLGNGQNKSISMWFKRSSLSSKGMLLSYQQASPGNWNPLAYIGSDGVLRGWMYQGGGAAWNSGITVDTNWHHLVLVYTTNTQTAYLDGSQVATMGGIPSPGASNIIYIGNGYANTGIEGILTTGNQPFSGLIDEVRFYNAVLSLAQINTLRTSPFLITTQPQNQSVCSAETVNLSLNVLTPDMGSTFDYQWTFNGTPLSNGGSISGANTNNLQISNAQASNAG
ncbi:MAG: LamG-like jellyroll fold domain-containing protein, partial [Flavobacteriales bacterium]